MKLKQTLTLATLLTLLSGVALAAPFGTAFTYQGRLNSGGNPASGVYDLRFTLYEDAHLRFFQNHHPG